MTTLILLTLTQAAFAYGGACARPSSGCDTASAVYKNFDCDGDGVLDHVCTSTSNNGRWVALSSSGDCSTWVSDTYGTCACARPSTGCDTASAVYKNYDCDGDGVLDHVCTSTKNYGRWVALSSYNRGDCSSWVSDTSGTCACTRPTSGCDSASAVYKHVDCDGDGEKDHICTTTYNGDRWVALSSSGDCSTWVKDNTGTCVTDTTDDSDDFEFRLPHLPEVTGKDLLNLHLCVNYRMNMLTVLEEAMEVVFKSYHTWIKSDVLWHFAQTETCEAMKAAILPTLRHCVFDDKGKTYTMLAGSVIDAGLIAGFKGTLGVYVDTTGREGCFWSQCSSFGLEFKASIGAMAGILLGDATHDLPKLTVGRDLGVNYVEGLSVSYGWTDKARKHPWAEVSLGVGTGVNVDVTTCHTELYGEIHRNCPKPKFGCDARHDRYEVLDCDGDGTLDHMCISNPTPDTATRWTALSSREDCSNWVLDITTKCVDRACARPMIGCTNLGDTYVNIDCDGDGTLDHVCMNGHERWVALSNHGKGNCREWVKDDKGRCAVTECGRPVDGCTGPGDNYIQADCDGDGKADHVCLNGVDRWVALSKDGDCSKWVHDNDGICVTPLHRRLTITRRLMGYQALQ